MNSYGVLSTGDKFSLQIRDSMYHEWGTFLVDMPLPTLWDLKYCICMLSVRLIFIQTNLVTAITPKCMKGIHSCWVEVHVLTMTCQILSRFR